MIAGVQRAGADRINALALKGRNSDVSYFALSGLLRTLATFSQRVALPLSQAAPSGLRRRGKK